MKVLKLITYFVLMQFAVVIAQEKGTLGKIPNLDLKLLNGKKTNVYKLLESGPLLIDFWATWCKPCLDEIPSLNKLQVNEKFKSLKIIPINVGQEPISNSINFFKKLKIENLDIFFDKNINLPKKFSLRGLPTSILLNKNGEEFARIIGAIDFNDEDFIKWLLTYDKN